MKLSRRSFLLATGAASLAQSAQAAARPSIVLIMADDLGYGEIAPYGQRMFETPHLSRMASEGVLFTDFYSGAPVCAPARTSILTGRHVGDTLHQTNAPRALWSREHTIAEALKATGYRTAMIGKWALGDMNSTGQPDRKGFDHWFGFLDQGAAQRHYPREMMRNGVAVPYTTNQGKVGEVYANDEFTSEAISFIRHADERPYFMYLPLTLPHADISAPRRWMQRFEGRYPEVAYVGQHYVSQPSPRAAFAAMMSALDETVGKIMQAADESGRETLIIFTSDNGPATAGGKDSEFFNSSGPLRGAKWGLYEGGIRVPLIVRWGGRVPAGATHRDPAYFPDLMPTLLEAAGLSIPPHLSGQSLMARLTAPTTPTPDRPLYWAFAGPGFRGGDPAVRSNWDPVSYVEAIRHGRWKLIRRGDHFQLFDLASDIGEQNNVAEARTDIVVRLAAMMGDEGHRWNR